MTENIKTMIEQLNDNEFILPVGYVDSEGIVHRKVTLAPMTGETEEAIADPKVRDNGGKVITELLYSVVESIDGIPRINKDIIRDLTTIDRDFLVVQNRKVSFGEELSFDDLCPHCKGRNTISLNINDLETKYLPDDAQREFTFDIPNGVRDKAGELHKTVTIVLPTGRTQEKVMQIIRSNPAQATTAMLQLITVRIGTMEYIYPEIFRKMTKKDRDFISEKLAEVEAGVDIRVNTVCSECGSEFTTTIPLTSFMGE